MSLSNKKIQEIYSFCAKKEFFVYAEAVNNRQCRIVVEYQGKIIKRGTILYNTKNPKKDNPTWYDKIRDLRIDFYNRNNKTDKDEV